MRLWAILRVRARPSRKTHPEFITVRYLFGFKGIHTLVSVAVQMSKSKNMYYYP